MKRKYRELKAVIKSLKSALDQLDDGLFGKLYDLRDILSNGPRSRLVIEMNREPYGISPSSIALLFGEILEEIYRRDYQLLREELTKASGFLAFREVSYFLLLPHPEISASQKAFLLKRTNLKPLLFRLPYTPLELVENVCWQAQLEEALWIRFRLDFPQYSQEEGSTL